MTLRGISLFLTAPVFLRCGICVGYFLGKLIVLTVILSTLSGVFGVPAPAYAHGKKTSQGVSNQSDQDVVTITATIETNAPPKVINAIKNDRLHIQINGAISSELHLHGYDISADTSSSGSAIFELHAIYTGRFPIVAHGVEDLLGNSEKAILYLEIRDQ